MKNITKIILIYREALIHLWNTYYVIDPTCEDNFVFEVDKAFSLIEKGLFDSLVQAKIFDYALEPGYKDCWDIYVIPKKRIIKAIAGVKKGLDCNWEDYELLLDETTYKFNTLFDWDQEGIMKGEFVRVKPFNSQKELQYTDFLFKIEDVDFYIKN